MLEYVRVKEVHAAVDDVAHKRARLLHVVQDLKTEELLRFQGEIVATGTDHAGLLDRYLVCLFVFNDTAVIHGLLSVGLMGGKTAKRLKINAIIHAHIKQHEPRSDNNYRFSIVFIIIYITVNQS